MRWVCCVEYLLYLGSLLLVSVRPPSRGYHRADDADSVSLLQELSPEVSTPLTSLSFIYIFLFCFFVWCGGWWGEGGIMCRRREQIVMMYLEY